MSDEEDMQTALPDLNTPAILTSTQAWAHDEACFAFCAANPDLNVARTRDGEIIIVPPAGRESDRRTLEAGGVLREWAIVLENLLIECGLGLPPSRISPGGAPVATLANHPDKATVPTVRKDREAMGEHHRVETQSSN